MPRRPKGAVPSLRHHNPSGHARVTINGRDHWLGKWGRSGLLKPTHSGSHWILPTTAPSGLSKRWTS